MSRVVVGCFALVALSLFALPLHAADGPSPDVPELKVLDHYAGTWDVTFETTEIGFSKGEASSKWILDGRYLQTTSSTQSADGAMKLSMTTLMTYDVNKKAYRGWTFVSNGTNSQSNSTWDEKSKTYTTISSPDGNGIVSKITADFSEQDVEKWKIVIQDKAGTRLAEIRGKNTKRK